MYDNVPTRDPVRLLSDTEASSAEQDLAEFGAEYLEFVRFSWEGENKPERLTVPLDTLLLVVATTLKVASGNVLSMSAIVPKSVKQT